MSGPKYGTKNIDSKKWGGLPCGHMTSRVVRCEILNEDLLISGKSDLIQEF